MSTPKRTLPKTRGENQEYATSLAGRHRRGKTWEILFRISTAIGILTLIALLVNIANTNFGYIAIEYEVDPDSLAVNGIPMKNLHQDDLAYILRQNISENTYRMLENEKPIAQRSQPEMVDLVTEWVVQPYVVETWTLGQSLFDRPNIYAEVAEKHPQAEILFDSWLDLNFITSPQSSNALKAGVLTAILGSLWVIAVTIFTALPIGIGAAIYLEEYARDTPINRLIQTNINNLAGVPSIVYGMLGLAIFVRILEPITSGAIFGYGSGGTGANGRTILSAGLTMALVILPIVIINAQEAIRAVPNSLREASYGMGATKWQTVWHHVLPSALPGILTGTILATSRALGETAPLVVVGASTYITFNPDNVFSKFTTLPMQIYQWATRPQGEFRNLASAAIIVLMVLLLSLNALAIILRNRYSRRIQ